MARVRDDLAPDDVLPHIGLTLREALYFWTLFLTYSDDQVVDPEHRSNLGILALMCERHRRHVQQHPNQVWSQSACLLDRLLRRDPLGLDRPGRCDARNMVPMGP